MEKYYNIVEITTNCVKLLIGYYHREKIYVIDAISKKCDGVSSNGLITDDLEVSKVLREIVQEEKNKLNILIDEVAVIIPAFNFKCYREGNLSNTVDATNIVQHIDIKNAITPLTKKEFLDQDLGVINVVPDMYLLDNNEQFIDEPIGKVSRTVTVHASIYACSKTFVSQYINAVTKAGLTPISRLAAPVSGVYALKDLDNIPNNYFLVDIGKNITTVSQIFNRHSIVSSSTYKFGGNDVISYVSNKLNISYSEAENLVYKYGIDENPTFKLEIAPHVTFGDLSAAIIEGFKTCISNIKSFADSTEVKTLPIVIAGGCSNLYHIESLLSDETGLQVIDYTIPYMGARDKGFINLLGAIRYLGVQSKYDNHDLSQSSITRVDTRRIYRNSRLDEEL